MKKIAIIILASVISLSIFRLPVMAAEPLGEDKAVILKNCAEAEDGIRCILEFTMDIMTIGIGILGVIGISVVGVQYLTAGGNEEKTRKAKRRMFEIIIGLAAYAVLYALLKFLGIQPN